MLSASKKIRQTSNYALETPVASNSFERPFFSFRTLAGQMLSDFALNDRATAVVATVRTCPVHELGLAAIRAFHCCRRAQPVVIVGATLARACFRILTSWVSHNATWGVYVV